MAVAFGSASTVVTSTTSTITPTMPASIAAGNLLILFLGLRQDTASAPTPTGWTLLGSVNGGGGTAGNATGPSRLSVFYRVATGDANDTLPAITITGFGITSSHVIRLTNATGGWSVAGASGSDSTIGTAWSVACDTNPGLTAGDFVVGSSASGQSAATWASHAVSATGVSAWSAFTEVAEINNTANPDINGATFYGSVTTGTATANPVYTATLSGTTTNSRGVSLLVRARETAPSVTGTGSLTATAATLTGSGTLNLTGTGVLDAQPATLTGSGNVTTGGGGSGTITHVGTAATVIASGTGTAITTTLPSGVQEGDFLVLEVVQGIGPFVLTNNGSGWTKQGSQIVDTDTTAPAQSTHDVWTKFAGAGETAPTLTADTATRWHTGIRAFRGVDTSAPFIEFNGARESVNQATHTAPTLTNTDANAWGLFTFGGRQVATPYTGTAGSGLTERIDQDNALATTTNTIFFLADSNGPVATGSVTYSMTASATATHGVMWAALLKPASAGGGGDVTGSGAIAASAATLTGSAAVSLNGTGALAATPATLSGSSAIRILGTGALAASPATLTGSATVAPINFGTGTLAATPATLTGSATLRVTGTGALPATPATLTGSATLHVAGTGAFGAAPATLSGAGAVRATGSGALMAAVASITGSATLHTAGMGALAAQPATLEGDASVFTPGVGTGILVAAPAALSGSGAVRLAGGGSLVAAPVTLNGSVVIQVTGAGTLEALVATLSGAATLRITGSATLVAPVAILSGSSIDEGEQQFTIPVFGEFVQNGVGTAVFTQDGRTLAVFLENGVGLVQFVSDGNVNTVEFEVDGVSTGIVDNDGEALGAFASDGVGVGSFA